MFLISTLLVHRQGSSETYKYVYRDEKIIENNTC